LADGGIPRDLQLNRRIVKSLITLLPKKLVNYLVVSHAQARFDHQLCGIEPASDFTEKGVLVNDDLPAILYTGKVQLREDIKDLVDNRVTFTDGSYEDDIYAVIYATGYQFGYRFVKHPAFEFVKDPGSLYRFTFPVDIQHPTIAAIGYLRLKGSIMAAAEMQSRWVMKVFKVKLL